MPECPCASDWRTGSWVDERGVQNTAPCGCAWTYGNGNGKPTTVCDLHRDHDHRKCRCLRCIAAWNRDPECYR